MEKVAIIPEGVTVEVDGFTVKVKGEKGELERDFANSLYNDLIKIAKDEGKVKVWCDTEKRKIKSAVGTIASHVSNMVKGVSEGYTYTLKIVYLHFPMTVKVSGNEVLVSNFLGAKSNRKAKIVGNSKVEIKGDTVTVEGSDREEVGQTAANIEKATHISSRDRRIFQDGIFINSKG
jgi:large subunit ribosomal protein L6